VAPSGGGSAICAMQSSTFCVEMVTVSPVIPTAGLLLEGDPSSAGGAGRCKACQLGEGRETRSVGCYQRKHQSLDCSGQASGLTIAAAELCWRHAIDQHGSGHRSRDARKAVLKARPQLQVEDTPQRGQANVVLRPAVVSGVRGLSLTSLPAFASGWTAANFLESAGNRTAS